MSVTKAPTEFLIKHFLKATPTYRPIDRHNPEKINRNTVCLLDFASTHEESYSPLPKLGVLFKMEGLKSKECKHSSQDQTDCEFHSN